MDDNKLRDLLRELPRESVSADFRVRVLSRLDGADRRNRARRRAVPVLAFAVALLVTAGVAVFYSLQRREQRIEQARLESLELEYRAIEQDFQELQRAVAAAQPVVGIEGPGERGYLVDLPELAKARAEGSVPVAYRLPH
jgi:hypothetical protein